MKRHWLTRGLPLLALMGLLATPAFGSYNEAQDVQALNGDPAPNAHASHVNDYRFQPDQLNLNEKSGLVKVLRTDQKILTNDYDVAIVPIRNCDRREIRSVMRRVTAMEGGRAEVFADKVTGKGAWIEVVAPKFMIPYLKSAIAELDVPWLSEYNDGGFDLYYKAIHCSAVDVNTLAASYADDTEGYSIIDTYNNAIRHYGEQSRQADFKKAAAIGDIPCNQVLLDVKMYEVANNNDLKLGLDYIAWKNGPGSNLFNLMEEGYTDNPYRQTSNHTSGNWAYRAANYALPSSYIDFLQAKGQAKVITSGQLVLCSASTGTISAENAIVAHVSNTDEIGSALASPSVMDVKTALAAYEQNKKDTAASMSSNNTPPPPTAVVDSTTLETERQAVLTAVTSSATSYKAGRALSYSNAGKTGITLTLTPYVGLESMELDMNVQIGELNGYAPNGTPILNTRTVATTIRLLDGQPFAIAGIKRANTSETSSKVPLLGAIPVVGYLFGGEQTLKRTDDLVITITPTFCLASQVNVLKPPVIDDMQNIFDGKKPQGTPDLKFGFDQYLIGG